MSEEDVMLMDNGKQVFVWFGKNASEVEKKLGVKSAQVCVCTSVACSDTIVYQFQSSHVVIM